MRALNFLFLTILLLLFVNQNKGEAASVAYVINSGNNTISVIDIAAGEITATIPAGEGNPKNVAITPDGTAAYVTNNYVYSSDTSSYIYTVSVIDIAAGEITATIPIGGGSRGSIAITPDGTKVYVVNANDNSVSIIDVATNRVIGTPIPVGRWPLDIAIIPDGTKVYVSNSGDNTVSVIDAANEMVSATVAVGDWPLGVAITLDGTKVYVTNSGDGTVSVIDVATNLTGIPILVEMLPTSIAITPDGRKAYVSNSGDNSVSVIDVANEEAIGTSIPVGFAPSGVAFTPIQQPELEWGWPTLQLR